MTDILTIMLIAGLFLSFVILGIFIWSAKQGQFDDNERIKSGLLFDSEDDLNDAINREKYKNEAIKKHKKKSITKK